MSVRREIARKRVPREASLGIRGDLQDLREKQDGRRFDKLTVRASRGTRHGLALPEALLWIDFPPARGTVHHIRPSVLTLRPSLRGPHHENVEMTVNYNIDDQGRFVQDSALCLGEDDHHCSRRGMETIPTARRKSG